MWSGSEHTLIQTDLLLPSRETTVSKLQQALAHVLWIGRATDSGKTSVARALAERYGLQAYHLDLYDRTEIPLRHSQATSLSRDSVPA